MGLFSGQTPCESDVEKATSEKNAKEEWGIILEICDKAGKTPQDAKDYLKAILRRIGNQDPHVAIQAITLLDACIKNCGKTFQVEVASRDFETEYIKLLKKSIPPVCLKLKEALKRWAEGEFKTDKQLTLIPTLYSNLKKAGTDFNVPELKKTVVLSKDPNVVQSQDEEDQIAKAIELSLKETSSSPRHTQEHHTSSSLYPSTNVSAAMALPVKEERKVRALYDFEAAEDNELTFSSGEIIFVIDDTDPNWWKGKNQRGEGLFPANFVTSDLSLDPDQLLSEKQKKLIELDQTMDKKLEEMKEPDNIEIDEVKIDRLLHLLHEADPTNPEHDTKEMLQLEREVNSMGSLIDKELERVDRKHAQLTQLSSDLVEAFNLYHTLMKETQYNSIPMNKMPYGYQPTQPPSLASYNGTLPHPQMQSMGPQSMMPYNTLPHDRSFIPPQGPMLPRVMPPGLPPPQNQQMNYAGGPLPLSMPSQISAPPQSLPPMSMQMHHQLPPQMPPQQHHHQQQQQRQDEPRLPGSFQPHGFQLGGIVNLPQNPGQQQPLHPLVGPQNGFQMLPPTNTHIM